MTDLGQNAVEISLTGLIPEITGHLSFAYTCLSQRNNKIPKNTAKKCRGWVKEVQKLCNMTAL
jgi:hypothetical protein